MQAKIKLILLGFTFFVFAVSVTAKSNMNSVEVAKHNPHATASPAQIIADHTIVDQYDKIPLQYIDSVKKMLVWVAGMSHSIGYQHGVELLELYDSKFKATTYMTATPPAAANEFLRIGRPQPTSAGMWSSDFWRDYHSSLMLNQARAANPYAVFLYAWCYDMTWHNTPQGAEDPVYHVRWAGDSEFGTGSTKQWGLDDADSTLTGNGMNMGTYLLTIEKFNSDALKNGYKTLSVFTTGPVDEDSETETGFQRELKQDYIRAYVTDHPSSVLFDYADILSYNNEGEKNIVNWNDGGTMRSFEQIHPDNIMDYNESFNIINPDGNGDPIGSDHIGEVGALRLAKAMWWMLARIAGWNGEAETNAVYYVAVDGDDANPGTIAQPWATWQKAFETAVAGDTVYFRGGVYRPSESAYWSNVTMIDPDAAKPVGHSGEPGKPICYFNYPGETPILDCSLITPTENFNTALEMRHVHFVNFRGLTIRNAYQITENVSVRAVMLYVCSNLTFENCTVHDCNGAAFSYFSGLGPEHGIEYDTTRWINCDAYNNADLLGVTPGNHADGWKCDQDLGGYFYFEGCRAWNNSDDGFDVSGPAVAIFKNCWSFCNGWYEAGNGNGFKTGAIRDTIPYPTRIITNCLAAYNHGPTNSGAGFDFVDSKIDDSLYYRVNARVYNNTSYKNDIGFLSFHNAIKSFQNNVFRNNIAFGSTYKQDGIPYDVYMPDYPYPESNNSWVFLNDAWPPWFLYSDKVTVTDDDFVSLDSTQLYWPRKADGSLPDIDFLKLEATSDLIDAGTQIPLSDSVNLILNFFDTAPDIGAFEYSPPDTILLQNKQFGIGNIDCFDATQTITTAGNGTTFVVEDGGTVDLIAGQNIIMLPGTHAHEGSYLHASITTEGLYCRGTQPIEPPAPVLKSIVNNFEITTRDTRKACPEKAFFNVYPNPTKGQFIVDLSVLNSQGKVEVTIYGVGGRRIQQKNVFGNKHYLINIEGQLPGVYLVQVRSNNKVGVRRIIKL